MGQWRVGLGTLNRGGIYALSGMSTIFRPGLSAGRGTTGSELAGRTDGGAASIDRVAAGVPSYDDPP